MAAIRFEIVSDGFTSISGMTPFWALRDQAVPRLDDRVAVPWNGPRDTKILYVVSVVHYPLGGPLQEEPYVEVALSLSRRPQ